MDSATVNSRRDQVGTRADNAQFRRQPTFKRRDALGLRSAGSIKFALPDAAATTPTRTPGQLQHAAEKRRARHQIGGKFSAAKDTAPLVDPASRRNSSRLSGKHIEEHFIGIRRFRRGLSEMKAKSSDRIKAEN